MPRRLVDSEESDAFSDHVESESDFDVPKKKGIKPVKAVTAATSASVKPKKTAVTKAVTAAKSVPLKETQTILPETDEFQPVKRPKARATATTTKSKKPVTSLTSDDEQDDDVSQQDMDTENIPSSQVLGSQLQPLHQNKKIEDIYQKKTQLEHILLRPDTYIGSVEAQQQPMWIHSELSAEESEATKRKVVLQHKTITFVPGLYKIFDEILVNAADNKIRDPTMDTIKVDIDTAANRISVYNNGRGIPIVKHAKEGIYVPELIFGHLLTSSNYDDKERKVTGGRNGYGAKLCNIFSQEFRVETADRERGLLFTQTYHQNMSQKSEPQLTRYQGEDFTRISFKPDLKLFGLDRLDEDHASLFRKRAVDLAGCLSGVKVLLNGTRIPVKDFKSYCELYLTTTTATTEVDEMAPSGSLTTPPPLIFATINDRWQVGCTVSDGQFHQVSFVNSICTTKGGTHVNHITDQLVTSLMEAVKKKNKSLPLKPFQIKNHLHLFVNCLIENPSFDSQTKENMTLKQSSFGRTCPLPEEFLKKWHRSGVIDNILSFARQKQDQQMKKTDGTKTSRINGIPKLDDANLAGTKQSAQCTLILTEGDSAKALAVSGLSVVGRDYYGVFPLRGKLLNVREASAQQILDNQEINHVKRILGLQTSKSYTSVDSLRYGHVMIMTDQDHDGSHIKGLLINLFDTFWPSLLKIPGFLVEFITPIVKATRGTGAKQEEFVFYTLPEYDQWKQAFHAVARLCHIKYYKGLGTSTSQDAKKYFEAMAQHKKAFAPLTVNERGLIEMAFSKKKADERKEWLRLCEPGTFMDHSQPQISYSDFINKELILFSLADNIRSIPNMMDGLKPGQRKILFGCFKRNLKQEMKVAQLAGYVSEHAAYHHGEQSLCATIVNLAQHFVGSNNVQLLAPVGQFGTRLQGGKDAASARYIFTNLSSWTRLLFPSDDDALLNYLNDDGQSIEPDFYVPILPMVLVNGAEGIGTGWSTMIPNYNPLDVIDNLKRLMRHEEMKEMTPWFRGFNGTIQRTGSDKFTVYGQIYQLDEETLLVTELPLYTWTQQYKEFLELALHGSEKQAPLLKDYQEYHSDTRVTFVLHLTPEQMQQALSEGIEKRFKMSMTLHTGNMVCFDPLCKLKKYASPLDILQQFYSLRLQFYQKRKQYKCRVLTEFWQKLENQCRFIAELNAGTLIIQERKKSDVVAELKKRGYKEIKGDEDAEETSTTSLSAFDYLLSMSLMQLTLEKKHQLENEKRAKQAELDALLALSPQDLWCHDLSQFETLWKRTLQEEEEREQEQALKLKKKMPKTILKKMDECDWINLVEKESKQDAKPVIDVEDKPVEKSKTVKKTTAKTKQTTLTSFLKPVNAEDSSKSNTIAPSDDVVPMEEDLDALPLNERIARILASKKTTSTKPMTEAVRALSLSSSPEATLNATKSVIKKPVKKATTAKAASKSTEKKSTLPRKKQALAPNKASSATSSATVTPIPSPRRAKRVTKPIRKQILESDSDMNNSESSNSQYNNNNQSESESIDISESSFDSE